MRESLDEGRVEFLPAAPARTAARVARDAAIRAEIMRGFAQAPWVDTHGVSIVVTRGEVRIAGSVPEPGARQAVREIAARCGGVRAIDDRLVVAGE
jgi:osmotically-inducible protein OsmY